MRLKITQTSKTSPWKIRKASKRQNWHWTPDNDEHRLIYAQSVRWEHAEEIIHNEVYSYKQFCSSSTSHRIEACEKWDRKWGIDKPAEFGRNVYYRWHTYHWGSTYMSWSIGRRLLAMWMQERCFRWTGWDQPLKIQLRKQSGNRAVPPTIKSPANRAPSAGPWK